VAQRFLELCLLDAPGENGGALENAAGGTRFPP
jgi:hypothetical protein